MRGLGEDRWRRHLAPLGSPCVAAASYSAYRLDVVYFGDGETKPARPYREALLARVRLLGPEAHRTRILIRGYANSGRGSMASRSLALLRSMAVADALYEAGVSRGQVRIRGPEILVSGPTSRLAQRSYNRRVELLFQPNALSTERPRKNRQRPVEVEGRDTRALDRVKARRTLHRHASP